MKVFLENVAAGQACELLTRDLVMKVSPDARKKALDRDKPVDDPFAKDFLVEIVGGFMDDKGLKPNSIELGKGIVSQLR